MNMALRIPLVLIVVVAVFYFVFWVPFSFTSLHGTPIPALGSLACALVAGWFVWKATDGEVRGVLRSTAFGAAVVGGIGFVGGFFGPLIFAPGANQGPLLGLFITGPLGFLLGGVGGFVYGLMRRGEPAE